MVSHPVSVASDPGVEPCPLYLQSLLYSFNPKCQLLVSQPPTPVFLPLHLSL